MTLVACTFVLPTGEPMALATVEVQLSHSAHMRALTGIALPRPIYTTTDEFGKVTVELWPSTEAYFVHVVDTVSEAELLYKFVVPLVSAGTVLRLQDLLDETVLSCDDDDSGSGNTGSLGLTSLVVVNGTNVGAAIEGTVFPIGMTFQAFVEAVSIKANAVNYLAPILSLVGTPAPATTEVGTVLSIGLLGSFTQRDAGIAGTLTMKRNGTNVASLLTFTDAAVTVTETPVGYQCEVVYAAGAVKNNNLGVPSPAGQIPAGIAVSNTVTYVGKRKAFFGTPASTPTSSAAVRSLGTSSFSAEDNPNVTVSGTPNFTIAVPAGATRVSFAYPSTARSVASVQYVELQNSEIKGVFTETTVSVEGVAGYASTSYRVFTYIPVEPFASAVTYKVFI